MALILVWIADHYIQAKEYSKALEHIEKSIILQKEVDYDGIGLWTKTILFIAYKELGIEYSKKEILELIKKDDKLHNGKRHYAISYLLYQLLNDKSYIKDAYNDILESTTLQTYKFPKMIIEEYNKAFKK